MPTNGAVTIAHPNRERPESRSTRAIVVGLLVAGAALTAVVLAGGWPAIQGAKAVQIGYVVLYLVLALGIARWRSGLLPVAAAFAMTLAIFAAISGPQWFERDAPGFAAAGLDASLLGVLTLLLVPLQLLLVAFAARGFAQRWSVEVERPA